MVGTCTAEVGDSPDLLLGELAALGGASPTGRPWPPFKTCANGWRRWPRLARRCAWMGWRPGCNARRVGQPEGPVWRSGAVDLPTSAPVAATML